VTQPLGGSGRRQAW